MFDAIVLAGGAARRLGGADKPALDVGGVSLLDRALDAVSGASRTVVAGPNRPTLREVIWCQEQPPGGGPVAALAAAVAAVLAETVVVLAADLPWVRPAVPLLVDALSGPIDAAVLAGSDGRRNHLAAAWRTNSLRAALSALPKRSGAAARSLYDHACVVEVADQGDWSRDCDTWDEVAAARHRAGPRTRRHRAGETPVTNPLAAWTAELAAALGVDVGAVEADLLLDVARDAAHAVARPAAPITTFLVGLAAGQRGGDSDAVREAAGVAQRLAARHAVGLDNG